MMDMKSFSDNTFDPKAWINQAFHQSNKDESKQVFVQNTLSTLQLYMQQLNHSLEEATSQVVSGLPRIIRESSEVEENAKGLRVHVDNLEDALSSAQHAADHPLITLKRTDRLKTKLESVRQELQEADKWATLTSKLESALEAGQPTILNTFIRLIEDMNECLEILSGSSDFEDKRLQLEALKNRLEAVISPGVVEAFTGQNTDKCKEYWILFDSMGRKETLSVYRARCEDGALRSRLPSAMSIFSPSSLRDLHTILLRHASNQLEWAPMVCPGEETLPWLIKLFTSVLSDLMDAHRFEDTDAKTYSSATQLDKLAEHIAACDHFTSEMVLIIQKEQGKKGNITEKDIKEFGYVIYTPVRNALGRLGKLLVGAMNEDLEPAPAIDIKSPDIGTMLQLRVARGLRTLTSRLNQGVVLSRGSAHLHLLYASQWLIEDLCNGWSSVDNLSGCLSLLKGAAQIQQLVVQANNILNDTKEEEALLQKYSNWMEPLRDWKVLLKNNFIPIVSSLPLNSAPDKLCKDLRRTALNLLLAPISTYLDCMNTLKGWSDNDQHAMDLPDFSLTPQEYITQVGQYLINLPQHLEPLLERGEVSSTEENSAYQFLNEVCNSACDMFASKIESITMDSLGVRKCSTDIDYLFSVLEELEAGSTGIQTLTEALKNKQMTIQNTE